MSRLHADPEPINPLDYQRVVHELRTHQIELELQNEQLRATECRLRDTSKRFVDLYDFAPVAYFTITGRGVIRDVNLKGSTYLLRDRLALIGTLLGDCVAEQSQATYAQHLREVAATTSTKTCDIRLVRSDGEAFDAQMDSEAWRDGERGQVHIRSILTDVTAQKRIEAELRAAKGCAETASKAKSQFLANISHEIRTPLGVMIGFAEVLLETPVGAKEHQEALRAIGRNGAHLLTLIDDLLDLAKIEAGKLRIERLSVALKKELDETLEQLRPQAAAKGLTLEVDCQVALPPTIVTDPTRFRQIVFNLVGNAIKFSAAGGVKVTVGMAQGLLQLEVADTGCGIPPEHRGALFGRFMQADESTTRAYGGTGLGLCLSRRIAEALGGNVELVWSEPGRGSLFRITVDPGLPALPPRPAATPPADGAERQLGERPLRGIEILLVEDGQDNQRLFRRILEHAGARVDLADDGLAGVRLASGRTYDVILMDIQLPLMDGYAATAALRTRGYEGPILALTAHAFAEERQKAEQTGFSAYLSKPIDRLALTRTIAQWTGRALPAP